MAPSINPIGWRCDAPFGCDNRIILGDTSHAIAKQAERWRTGRTGAGKTRECPRALSTTKQWGAGARIAHHGPASVDATVRGRIYVSSRTAPPPNGMLAKRGGVHIRTFPGYVTSHSRWACHVSAYVLAELSNKDLITFYSPRSFGHERLVNPLEQRSGFLVPTIRGLGKPSKPVERIARDALSLEIH